MKTIISNDQLSTFIILLRSDICRLNEIIARDSIDFLRDEDQLSMTEWEDMRSERDRLVAMCEDLGGESL